MPSRLCHHFSAPEAPPTQPSHPEARRWRSKLAWAGSASVSRQRTAGGPELGAAQPWRPGEVSHWVVGSADWSVEMVKLRSPTSRV